MRADGGDWVYRDGIVIHEPAVDRGPPRVCSADEMRDRLERRARRLGANAFAYVFIGLTIAGNWYLHLQPLMLLLAVGLLAFAAGLVALLVVHGVVRNRLLSSRTALPGIYERGVEPLERAFVPYGEVERTSRGNTFMDDALFLHLRGSGRRVPLVGSVYGVDGTRYVEARVRGLAGEGGETPRLVVYPRGEDIGETARKL